MLTRSQPITYSPHNGEKFPQRFETQSSEKGKIISAIFIRFLKSAWNFVYLQKKTTFIAYIFPKLLTPKNVLTSMPKGNCFGTPFGSERVHESQTLYKSPWEHFHPNFPLIQDKLSWQKGPESD